MPDLSLFTPSPADKSPPLPRAGEHRGRVAVTVGLLSVKMRVNLGFAAA